MTVKEIKQLPNEKLIASVYYAGVRASGDTATKKEEKELQHLYKELQRRGIIEDWKAAYDMVCH